MQKIIVTGASGHLGSHLVPALAEEGFEIVAIDVRPVPKSLDGLCTYHQLDVGDRDAVEPLLEGAELIVHSGSIHPWKQYSDAQYFDGNIKGMWNLYNAAVAAGVKKIVMTSSIAAVGYGGPETAPDWPLPESYSKTTGDLYSLTKLTQEEIARQFAMTGKVRTIALRPPAFMPYDPLATAFGLLGAYAVVEDIASAHVAAVRVMSGRQETPEPLKSFEPFYITNALPYRLEDSELLEWDGMVGLRLAAKYWPEHADWLKAKGFTEAWMPAVYDISKAERLLGWRPRVDFSTWVNEHDI